MVAYGARTLERNAVGETVFMRGIYPFVISGEMCVCILSNVFHA